ncbi:MAG: DUF177 domain-containing protein [Coriobacteriales bacterium]|jgi:uncharacterized protein|nr:DUF177 domain-containing protein [Coriobacteriales bacterium]
MFEFNYHLFPELAQLGDERELSGHIDLESIAKGGLLFELPKGIDYDLNLTNTGSGILLSGIVKTTAVGACARCLDKTEIELQGDVETYYVTRERDSELCEDDDEVTLVEADGLVDLAAPIHAALVECMPFVVLCTPDCPGICPSCGADLKSEPCCCSDEPSADHPLAALRELLIQNDQK